MCRGAADAQVSHLTDRAIYARVERYTTLERIHLSYCENISVPAVFWLLLRLPRLTHLSLTGVPAFRRPELQAMCAVVDPVAAELDEFAGGDHGRMPDHGHQVPLAAARQVAAALAEAFGGPAPEVTGQYRIGDVRHVVASPERAQLELGYAAGVTFEDGMREFATAELRAAPQEP